MCTELGQAKEEERRILTSLQSSDKMSDIWKWACTCFTVLPTFKCKLRFFPSRWVLRFPGWPFAASCFFFLSPWIQHFVCIGRKENLKKKKTKNGKRQFTHTWNFEDLKILEGLFLVESLRSSGYDLGKSCSKYPTCFLTEQSNFSILTRRFFGA